ncbi:MAG: hypothetical protein WBM02_02985 [bacterium]
MAKRSSGDSTGMSMHALIHQLLIDGKVHSLKQISDHMQQYMFKGMSSEDVQENVRLFLLRNNQIEKTARGYRLKNGASLMQVVSEILADILVPMSANEIMKLVAKKQGIPVSSVKLQLDEDEKIKSVTYSAKKFYYLSGKSSINEKVYKILKAKNRAMTIDEIFEVLQADEGCSREASIFFYREDNKFTKTSNKFSIKKKETPKSAPTEPRHYVKSAELEKVIDFLRQTQRRMTANELAEEVLNLPLEKTNLRAKLARDPRIKRENDKFYFEAQKTDKQVPVKIKEKLVNDYFKVKARMMGSSEIHTIVVLLDRIYGVNIATQDYDFYLQELEDLLLNDDETVRLLDDGWVHKSNELRTSWKAGKEFEPVLLPIPPSPLQKDKVTAAEQSFLDNETKTLSSSDKNNVVVRVTALDRKYGLVRSSELIRTIFPKKPTAYEIVLDLEEESDSYDGFVIVDKNLVLGLEMLFSDRLPLEGGIVAFTSNPDNPYRFTVSLDKADDGFGLTRDRLAVLNEMVEMDWLLPELIRELYRTSKDPFLSCWQVWAEVNLVRQASKEDVLATLKDYDCFLPIKSMDGFYSFDSTRPFLRLSYKEETQKVESVVVESVDVVEVPAEVLATDAEKGPGVKLEPAKDDKKAGKAKSKKKDKKEAARRSRKDTETALEELPEHLRKLKDFEIKLPKLKPTPQPSLEITTPVPPREKPARIGAVSTGRTAKTKFKPSEKGEEEATPILLEVPSMPKERQEWDTASFVNPQKGKGYEELYTALDILKSFLKRAPKVRPTDGSIVIFLDKNDIAVYFRIPPENQECWLAWIPDKSLEIIENKNIWLKTDSARAKKSDNGYWWATDTFRGPKGNFRDKNVIQGVEIIGKLLELMEQEKI